MNLEVLRRPDLTPPGPSAIAAQPVGLPADLAAKAGLRLGIMALMYAAAYAITYTLSRVVENLPQRLGDDVFLHPDVAAGIFIGISLLICALALSGRVNPYRLIGLGLIYEVVGAIGIEIDLLWWPSFGLWPPNREFVVNGISWTCPWIIAFPMLVPTTPGKAVLTALTAASVRPFVLLLLAAQGVPFSKAGVGAAALMDLTLPNYVCAGIAIVGARIVWGYGSHITKARLMGSYRLVEKLGEGGMGEVWKAEHRMLARPAAIKLIRSDLDTTSPGTPPTMAMHRFEREVQATAALRSPHTVVVYDYGYTDRGVFFYVMELLNGLSLQRAVEKHGPMPAERVIHILRQACHSLAEAHDQGMIHRDIKPGNLFVCRQGRECDFVKVLDFGLVKRLDQARERQVELTEVGAFAGTPAYGSPESALADREAIDARSDIYSLGCVAYWLLSGRTVFDAPTPVMMLVQHVKQEPDPPSHYSELEIPEALDALVLQCLRKDRSERPGSADELAARLAAVQLENSWTQERAREWWDLHYPLTERAAAAVRAPADL
ncbi:MAG: serine/threonine protein kinase [Gemmatimonadota bacterium]|nr:MAG: serine/threonine protein kinase [Gemmatimonadota bacterium]